MKAASQDKSVEAVIYHLGTNNLTSDDTQEIKDKVDEVIDLAISVYPNAKVGMCQVPKRKHVDPGKIEEVNKHINKNDRAQYIRIYLNESHFNEDGLHYNKHGLAVVGMNIKRWMKVNNLRPRSDTNSIHDQMEAPTPQPPQALFQFNPLMFGFPYWNYRNNFR